MTPGPENALLRPYEGHAGFLWVRRGLPLLLASLSGGAALLVPAWRGWFVLAAAAFFGVAWPTFKRGEAYLRARPAILRFDTFLVRGLRPLARILGREDAWILSFCGWNNLRVRAAFQAPKSRRTLILLPHCVQAAHCRADVFADLQNCYACGLCSVEDVMKGVLERRWEVSITNRSYKAYREARAYRPDLVVAVSCTDRLLKGLAKLSEVPAYVLPLALPRGMCVDTTFDFAALQAAMEALADPRPPAGVMPLGRIGAA
ncbi:MAG: DUF116 domain-containing protein [Acidobacteria bacterium]|nr:DUF116 domain-containing protein [Acidobacteriota bacterium]